MKLLIIEDDLNTREMYSYRLKKAEHAVVEANSGKEGLEILEKETFDGVLLDIMLPEMDGVTFLQSLRKQEDLNEQSYTPVIVISNLGQESVVKKCQEYDIKGYLIKARISPQELVKKVEFYLTSNN